MSTWLLALILGLVEGITEFIPVSSTGHLLLTENLLGAGKTSAFFQTDVFNAFIQVWAMLAALPLFRTRLATITRWREPKYRDYFVKMFVAFLITGIGGLAMKKMGLELPDTALPIALALLVGGVLFIVVERWLKGRPQSDDVTWAIALAIGCAQLVAVAFPGTSRSGATILIALVLGMGRPAATEFSFLLGVPTLCSAGAYTLYKALKAHEVIDWTSLAIASLAAAVASVLAVRWMLGYVRTHSFAGFGWYRVALALIVLGCYFGGMMH
jgi:undecaprenyl-diphosphatase